MPKCQRAMCNTGLYKHIKKPDVDNLIKLYLDVMSGIVFKDDNCVSLGSAIKVYTDSPRVEIYVQETQALVSMDEIYEGTWEIKI